MALSTNDSSRPVRSCLTLEGDGAIGHHATVYCDKQLRSVPLEKCLQCEQLVTARLGHAPGGPAILCEATVPRSSEDPFGAGIRAIMTRDVVCIRSDVTVEAIVVLLLARNVSAVPVVDARGRPIGVVSKTDILRDAEIDGSWEDVATAANHAIERGMAIRAARTRTAAEIMTPLAFTVSEDQTIATAAALMASDSIHRVFVVGRAGEIVGVVSAMDITKWVAKRFGFAR